MNHMIEQLNMLADALDHRAEHLGDDVSDGALAGWVYQKERELKHAASEARSLVYLLVELKGGD